MRNTLGFLLVIMVVVLATPVSAKNVNIMVWGEASCDAIPHPNYAPVAYVETIRSEPLFSANQVTGYRVLVINEKLEQKEYFSKDSFNPGEVLTLCKRGRNHKLAPLTW